MPVKILMCPCYKDYFKEAEVPILKHSIHFHGKYEEEDHEIFVHFCGSHPYGTTLPNVVEPNDVVEKKFFCKREHASRLCKYCIQIRYSLNFRCHKICLEKFPDFMLPRVKSFSDYLKQLDCDHFFYFDKDKNTIAISLDNPLMDKIPSRTDSRPAFYRS